MAAIGGAFGLHHAQTSSPRPSANRGSTNGYLLHSSMRRSGQFGARANRLGQDDLRLEIEQRIVKFLERVHLHEAAVGAGAMIGRAGNEILVRHLAPQPVEHARFGDDDEAAGWAIAGSR